MRGHIFREMMRLRKIYFQAFFSPIVSVLLYYIIFGLTLGQTIQIEGQTSYFAFLIPGFMTYLLIQQSFEAPIGILLISKYGGEILDFRAYPVSPHSMAWGITVGALFRGIILSIATYFLGLLLAKIGSIDVPGIKHPLLLIYFLLISGVIFANIGIWLGMWAKSYDSYNAIHTFLLMPFTYLGGVFYDINNLPPVFKTISHYNPIAYLIAGVRYAFTGESFAPIHLSLIVSILFFCLSYTLCICKLKNSKYYQCC